MKGMNPKIYTATIHRGARGRFFRTLACSVLSVLPLSAIAQSTGSAASASDEDLEVLELSPFTVEAQEDFGYRSTMAATASGSGLPIKDTPLSISIVNAEFMADKNITDVREALRGVPGLVASTTKEEREIYSRGFKPVVKVDGASAGAAVLSASFADRIEVVKGPVSVLQGVASAGGVVNIISRRPTWHSEYSLDLGVGSYGYQKGVFSASGPLLEDKVAYRVAASNIDSGGWVDYTEKRDQDYQLAFEFQPTKNISLLVDLQNANRDEVPHSHLGFTHPDFLAAELAAQANYDALGLERPLDDPTVPQIGDRSADWLAANNYPDDTPTEVVDVTEYIYPNGYEANSQGPDAYRNLESTRLFLEANVKFSDSWYLRSIYADYSTERDFSVLSTFRPSAGWTQTDRPNMQHALSKGSTFTNEVVGSFEVLGMSHRMLFGYQHEEQESDTVVIRADAAEPYDTINGPVRHIVSEVLADNPDGFPPLELEGGSVDGFYFIDQIDAFDERLHTLIGGRYSKSKQDDLESSKFTPQVGVVYEFTDWFSGFVSYGESFRPNFTVDGNGNIVDPTEESNFEYGIKLGTSDGKFSGTVSVYDMEQKNVALRDFALEAITGISPLYNVSGLAESKGAEAEFIYQPMRNYQVVASFAKNWTARTVVAQDERQEGVRLQGAPDVQFSFWNKYTFVDGTLKGSYIGFGAQYIGAIHVHPSWSAPIYSPEVWVFDATIGHKMTVGSTRIDLALRVNNVTDEFYYDQVFRPAFPRTFQLLARFNY